MAKKYDTHDDFEEIMLAVIHKKDVAFSDKFLQTHQMLMDAAYLLQEKGTIKRCIDEFANRHNVCENTARNYLANCSKYYQVIEPMQSRNFISNSIYGLLMKERETISAFKDEKTRAMMLAMNSKNLISFLRELPSSEAIDQEKWQPKTTINVFDPTLIVEAEMSEEALQKAIQELKHTSTSGDVLTFEADE